MKGTSTSKFLLVVALIAALGMFALAGCVSVRVDKSAGSSGSDDTSTSSSGVSLVSSDSASTGGTSTSSGTSASGTSASSGSSTPSQATVTPANQLIEVSNKEGGYTFMTDKAFYVTQEGKSTTIWLAESKAGTPYVRVETMDSSGLQTAEELVDGTMDTIVSRYQGRIVVEPMKNTVTVSSGTLYGFEYAYKSEDGSTVICALSYVEELGGKFVMYTGAYYQDDTLTPKVAQVAADTMKIQ